VLEAAWKHADPTDRSFWRGLAQIAVGLTHAQRGNATGAVALLRRGADELTSYEGIHQGIDVARVRGEALEAARAVEDRGTGALSHGAVRLRE
jgi:predicted metal-dependent hydrolase